VVTNYHVIKGASEVCVTLLDQSSYGARVVGFDETKDVAVLQLVMPEAEAGRLRPAALGSSAGLQVGEARQCDARPGCWGAGLAWWLLVRGHIAPLPGLGAGGHTRLGAALARAALPCAARRQRRQAQGQPAALPAG
jgi:hypothetical protein